MNKSTTYLSFSLILFILIGLFFSLVEPIPQDISYHRFADSEAVCFIPNFANVFSNVLFLAVGVLGLVKLFFSSTLQLQSPLKLQAFFIFSSAVLIGFGSAYYHWEPSNFTLLWDRLPMTILFMAVFSLALGEFVSVKLAKLSLFPLLFAGITSVLYWHWSEQTGAGDLRFYILIQFLPMLIIPIILVKCKSRYSSSSGYWWLILWYFTAKLFEFFDQQIFEILHFISGHSLMHLAAGIGLYFLLNYFSRRRVISS